MTDSPADVQTQPPVLQLSWRHLAYFVGVPLSVAIYASLNNWEMVRAAGLAGSMVFYLAHSMLPWWITCVSTTVTMRSLYKWKPPWVMILLIGHTIGCLIVAPYSNWVVGLYQSTWPALELTGEHAPVFSQEFWVYWARAGVIWLGVNYVFDRFVGLPLYRYVIPRGYETGRASSEPNDDPWGGRPPGFLERLPAELKPEEILAIKAEQHYIRVYSPRKEYMVLYRFSDAIRELDESLGAQVHRSYWVNKAAISSVHAKAKDFHVRINTGVDIPVSGPYQGLVRELARAERLASHG